MKSDDSMPRANTSAIAAAMIALALCIVAGAWLGWRQMIAAEAAWALQLLAGAALLAMAIMLFIRARNAAARPLDSIADWASRIRQGDFSARLESDDAELRGLRADINRLAEWLESLAESKDQELREQGARLAAQTRIVRLLYDIAGDFDFSRNDAQRDGDSKDDAAALLQRAMQPMRDALDARRIEFHRRGADGECIRVAACGDAVDADARCVTIPLHRGGSAHGECRIHFAAARFPLPDEFSQLLYTLGRNLGIALERLELHRESERLSRLRERSHLANELHDSLAQTIAGLRFEVRILDDLLQQQEEHAAWRQLEKVENMLEEANAELRSLIRYFHAPIEPGALLPAIRALVARCDSAIRNGEGGALFLQDEWGDAAAGAWPEQQQLAILRILQEALANVRKHSQAQNARVLLRVEADGRHSALVEDDGIGIADVDAALDAGEGGAHIGLSVMAQRARAIGAELRIDSEPGEGTRVLLRFRRASA